MSVKTTVAECAVEHVIEAVDRGGQGEPISLSQIHKALPAPIRPPFEALQSLVDAGVNDDRLFPYPPRRGQARYSAHPVEDLAKRRLVQKLQTGMSTKSVCLGVLKQAVFQALTQAAREQLFDGLVKAGVIRKLPAVVGGRSPQYSTRPPAARDYLDDALAKIAKKLQLTMDEVTREFAAISTLTFPVPTTSMPIAPETSTSQDSSPSDGDFGELILQAMHEINPRVASGDLVLIPELRQRLDFQADDKARFDQTLLRLYRDRRVVLSQISAALVSDKERDGFVVDEDGLYYNTAALWSR